MGGRREEIVIGVPVKVVEGQEGEEGGGEEEVELDVAEDYSDHLEEKKKVKNCQRYLS